MRTRRQRVRSILATAARAAIECMREGRPYRAAVMRWRRLRAAFGAT
jgi:hypothetical protein